MADAVANYCRYVASGDAWLLGRYIVPASRLPEFESALISNPPTQKIPVSVLTGPDLMGAVSTVLAFNAHSPYAVVDSLEVKAESPEVIRTTASAVPEGFTTYFEVAHDGDLSPLLHTIGQVNGRAKVRTGGLQEHSFPSTDDLAGFIRGCHAAQVPFKATAGLHHAVRGIHALTDEPDASTCTMHGFLNVVLAAVFLSAGTHAEEVTALLGEQHATFAFTPAGIGWRNHIVSTQQIRDARQHLFISFGSCSFEEPVNELRGRGLL